MEKWKAKKNWERKKRKIKKIKAARNVQLRQGLPLF
jgi:hypothetical protein